MVLLTITPSIVEGLMSLPDRPEEEREDDATETQTEPQLAEPAVGKPISHGQIVGLWKSLKSSEQSPSYSLEHLLSGSHVYVAPPPPKPEPVRLTPGYTTSLLYLTYPQTPEYKALMARLRRDEETRAYQRMVNPPHVESFYDRFPHASARAFAAVNQPISAADTGDDDDQGGTYEDIQRQVLLIFNFLVSILGVAGTLWVLARWWSLPARLFLSMGGGIAVGIAEVSVYSIYVWKMGDAKKRQKAVKEVKEVVGTWVDAKEQKGGDEKTVLLEGKEEHADGVRRRTATIREAD